MKYVALLRGINVGGNSKVDMKTLKGVFESLSFERVSTYINSGNVIFETGQGSEGLPEKIEKAITTAFGLRVRVLVRSAANIRKLSSGIPAGWKNDTEQKTDVLFLWDEFSKKSTLALIATNPAVDTLLYVSGAIVWNVDKKNYSKTGMKKFIGSQVYKHMTARNVNTVRKLAELLG